MQLEEKYRKTKDLKLTPEEIKELINQTLNNLPIPVKVS